MPYELKYYDQHPESMAEPEDLSLAELELEDSTPEGGMVRRILNFKENYNIWIFRVASIKEAKDVLGYYFTGAYRIDHLDIGGHGTPISTKFGSGVGGKLVAGDDETAAFFEWLAPRERINKAERKAGGHIRAGPLARRATIMLHSCSAGSWEVNSGVVRKHSLHSYAALHACDHQVTGSDATLYNPDRSDFFDEDDNGRWTGTIIEGGYKTTRTLVSCELTRRGERGLLEMKPMRKKGASHLASHLGALYRGAYRAHYGKLCPSYNEHLQMEWQPGDHGMVDRCALACDLKPECDAFTFVERSSAGGGLQHAVDAAIAGGRRGVVGIGTPDPKVWLKQDAAKNKKDVSDLKKHDVYTKDYAVYTQRTEKRVAEDSAQCHLSLNAGEPDFKCTRGSLKGGDLEWQGRIFTTFIKTKWAKRTARKAKKIQGRAQSLAHGLTIPADWQALFIDHKSQREKAASEKAALKQHLLRFAAKRMLNPRT